MSIKSRILRTGRWHLRSVVVVDYRYSSGCMCSEREETLQDGRQSGIVAEVLRVGVSFLAVGGHREDRGIGDLRLDVGEVRVVDESEAMRTRFRTWFWTWMLSIISFTVGLHHTTAAYKHRQHTIRWKKISEQVY